MTTEYRKTPDPNVFVKADASESFIYLDELTTSIDKVQEQIDALPEPKTNPDQETLNYYNENIEIGSPKEDLGRELNEKQELVSILKSLKAGELK